MARGDFSGAYFTHAGNDELVPEVLSAVVLTDGVTTYRYATRAITFRLSAYTDRLKTVSSITSSLNQGLQKVTVRLQNADLFEAPNVTAATYEGYRVTVYKILRDSTAFSGFVYLITFDGKVTGFRADETYFELDCVTAVNRAGNLSNRRVGQKCPWVFKDSNCGYVGVETTCDKLYDSAGGCSGRSNQHKFGGFPVRPAAAPGALAGQGKAPSYQLVTDGTTTYKQQPYLEITGASITNDDIEFKTVVDVSGIVGGGTGIVNNVINVKDATYGAVGDGITDDTTAVQNALNAINTDGKALYFPPGTYLVSGLSLTDKASIHIFGAGPGRSTIKSSSNAALLAFDTSASTIHSITIENLGFYGYGSGANNDGLVFKDTGGQGVFSVTCRNLRFENCGNSALRTTQGSTGTFTILLEGIDASMPAGASHAIDLFGSNDCTLLRCYVHAVATGKAAYRIRAGSPTLIGCNGIDSGTTATWGLFGNKTSEDGLDSYCRATLMGCNIESFTDYGVRCKVGSSASCFNTQFIAPASGTVTPIKFDYVTENQAGIFDAQSGIQTLGASYTNSQAIHSNGLPFIQIGHRDFTTYYDTAGAASASFPAITGSRITGTQEFALTLNGYTKIAGHLSLNEQSAPGTAPANTGYLYAKDTGGSATGLYWKSDGVAERRIDTPSASGTGIVNNVINVKDATYGAVGDGVTDDTAAVQAAIDAAEAGTVSRTVYFPPGTYLVTGLTASGNITLLGTNDKASIIKSTTNAVILDCTAGSFLLPRIEGLTIRGSVSAGSSQIGLKIDDGTYGLKAWVENVRIEDCGSHGLYIGNAFSSHFENIYSTNSAGCNYFINSANMPALTLEHCDSGDVRASFPVGYYIAAGTVTMRACNGIYGGAGTDWWAVVGREVGVYSQTVNSSAFVRFESCNFESNTVGGIRFLFNSSASFENCTWVGDNSASGSYKALLYHICLYNPTEATGNITSGTASLVVTDANAAATWTAGQGIKVAGAGVASADLTTTVASVVGTTITLNANASTTVTGALVTHTDEIYYPALNTKGVLGDKCSFSQSPASYYANSEPIHIEVYPTTGTAVPPLTINGVGPYIAGTKHVDSYRNDSAAKTRKLLRGDAFYPLETITASTSYDMPGIRYIECNHTAGITVTLPWPGWYNAQHGEFVVVKDRSAAGAGTYNITIQAGGGGTVNGAGSYVINQNKGAVILMPNGVDDWRLVGEYKSAAGALVFTDGSLGSPNNQRSGDSDTGLYQDASGWYFVKDGAEYARLSSNDNRVKGVLRVTSSGLGQSYITFPDEDTWIQFNNVTKAVWAKTGGIYPGSSDSASLGYVSGGEWSSIFLGTSADIGISSSKTGEIVLRNSSNANTLKLKAGATSTNTVLTLPTDDGTSGQYLKTDGTGVLSWDTPTTGANTALSNLASVAINTALLPTSDNTIDLGSSAKSFRDTYNDRDIFIGRRLQAALGSAPTTSTGTGAGTSPTLNVYGNDICGAIVLTTGTSPATSAKVFDLTFSTNFNNAAGDTDSGYPIMILQPANAAAAALSGASQVFVDDAVNAPNKATVKAGSSALAASTEYIWYYHVVGMSNS